MLLVKIYSEFEYGYFINWRSQWQPTLVFLPGEYRGQVTLVGCNPRGCRESYMTE